MHPAHKLSACLWLTSLLIACGGSSRPPSSCSPPAGSHMLTGTVTAVHDGDTLTLGTGQDAQQVRLQGIDAPELAQPEGNAARLALSAHTLHQGVQIAYTQRDRYDRILGQVIKADCTDVNLQLLNQGMAWFYRAYACDLERPRRLLYAAAESQARQKHLGLWSQSSPLAPWVFRNGDDPPAPVCID